MFVTKVFFENFGHEHADARNVCVLQIRSRHGIELEGSVLIFDEAHNLVSSFCLDQSHRL